MVQWNIHRHCHGRQISICQYGCIIIHHPTLTLTNRACVVLAYSDMSINDEVKKELAVIREYRSEISQQLCDVEAKRFECLKGEWIGVDEQSKILNQYHSTIMMPKFSLPLFLTFLISVLLLFSTPVQAGGCIGRICGSIHNGSPWTLRYTTNPSRRQVVHLVLLLLELDQPLVGDAPRGTDDLQPNLPTPQNICRG